MICYRDRTYCDTNENGCMNKECNDHLETDGEYSLKHNVDKLPIAVHDLSNGCDKYIKGIENE